jgi:hypothetical protein
VLARRLAKGGPLREILAEYDGENGGLRLIRAARDLDPRQTDHVAAARLSELFRRYVWRTPPASAP